MKELDIVRSKICQFCQKELQYHSKSMASFDCPDSHMRVWFGNSNYGEDENEWLVIRVLFNGFFIRVDREDHTSCLEIRKGDGNLGLMGSCISIPIFNIFQYSHSDLENKIKIISVFN
jgi:hypothetical protein